MDKKITRLLKALHKAAIFTGPSCQKTTGALVTEKACHIDTSCLPHKRLLQICLSSEVKGEKSLRNLYHVLTKGDKSYQMMAVTLTHPQRILVQLKLPSDYKLLMEKEAAFRSSPLQGVADER